MDTPQAMELDFVTLDVFTHERFCGNPLAIVNVPWRDRDHLGQLQKQLIAREFNFAETVFLHAEDPDSSRSSSPPYREIDIFTTTAEVPFAGHPTIGTACYLLSNSGAAEKDLREGTVITKAGPIPVSLNVERTEATARIPHDVHIHTTGVLRGEIISKQPGLQGRHLSQSHPVVSIVKGMTFVLVELPDDAALAALTITAPPLDVVLDKGWDGGLVGAYYFVKTPKPNNSSSTRQQLRARMPEQNLEDPATGSAACALASYLSLIAKRSPSTFHYRVSQGVEMGRRSEIGVEVTTSLDGGSHRVDSVTLLGAAVMVSKGKLFVSF